MEAFNMAQEAMGEKESGNNDLFFPGTFNPTNGINGHMSEFHHKKLCLNIDLAHLF